MINKGAGHKEELHGGTM